MLMSVADSENAVGDTHSFVIRLRVNEPPDPIPPIIGAPGLTKKSSETSPDKRLSIRIEHVNSADRAQHYSITGALNWLGDRMHDLTRSAETDQSRENERGPWSL